MYSSSARSNGYHHNQQLGDGRLVMSHRERVRRTSRAGSRSRDFRDDHGGGAGLRVSEHKQQEQQPQRPSCTDFDMAYFYSYAHVANMVRAKYKEQPTGHCNFSTPK
ncbi:hypothetical protein FNV43_RR13324 [Rhamnella rubrinervis]|uniref:Uncharacterized protein n=1 Tax=Rhamnella rubrinervis TaxID=2594499 RepID=A0A8K0H0Y1_9ROSA|nr:hypothetical protein FNV43_RR13324 [Rhamnella rubrinervis]